MDRVAELDRLRQGVLPFFLLGGLGGAVLLVDEPGSCRKADGGQHEGDEGQAREQGKDEQDARHDEKRRRIAAQLGDEREVDGAVFPAFRQQEGGSHRHNHGRDLRDEAVADRQDRIIAQRFGEAEMMHGQTDADAGKEVQCRDHETGDRIALHEF